MSLQAEVLGYLEKACQLIPDKGVTAECKEMVDNYYPVLMGIIKGELVSINSKQQFGHITKVHLQPYWMPDLDKAYCRSVNRSASFKILRKWSIGPPVSEWRREVAVSKVQELNKRY